MAVLALALLGRGVDDLLPEVFLDELVMAVQAGFLLELPGRNGVGG
jgi:hypothetical protein